jgi:hypothetical protein
MSDEIARRLLAGDKLSQFGNYRGKPQKAQGPGLAELFTGKKGRRLRNVVANSPLCRGRDLYRGRSRVLGEDAYLSGAGNAVRELKLST